MADNLTEPEESTKSTDSMVVCVVCEKLIPTRKASMIEQCNKQFNTQHRIGPFCRRCQLEIQKRRFWSQRGLDERALSDVKGLWKDV